MGHQPDGDGLGEGHLRQIRFTSDGQTKPAGVGALLFSACQSRPVELYSHAVPPVVLATLEDAGVRDLRANYRAARCRRLPANGPACEDVLLQLPGEGPPGTHPATEGLPGRYRIVFVGGFFAECFEFLLGYANADHWTIAIAVSEKTPAASFMFRDDFPRAELVQAALEVVAATLSVSEGN